MNNLWKMIPGIFLILLAIESSYGYGTGAPSKPEVCISMTPGHGGAPQKGAFPYTIEVSKQQVRGGDKVEVWIHSSPFKGFLVMGQQLNRSGLPLENGISLGTFSSSRDAQHVNCADKVGAVVTHINSDQKHDQKLEWVAPNEDGDYVILVTIVKDFNTYWVKQKSQTIRVRKDYQSEDGTQNSDVASLDPAATKLIKEYSSGCDKTKGCFGLPEGCLQRSATECEMFTTYRTDGSRFIFQIAGKLPTMPQNAGHVSVGLSLDPKMGQDSVIGCVLQNDKVQAKSYYNYVDKPQNSIMKDESAGIDKSYPNKGTYVGGVLFCEFARTKTLTSDELKRTFDLSRESYYLLLARAPLISKGEFGEKLGYHPTPDDKGSSQIPYLLTKFIDDSPPPGKGKSDAFKCMPSTILIAGVFIGQFVLRSV